MKPIDVEALLAGNEAVWDRMAAGAAEEGAPEWHKIAMRAKTPYLAYVRWIATELASVKEGEDAGNFAIGIGELIAHQITAFAGIAASRQQEIAAALIMQQADSFLSQAFEGKLPKYTVPVRRP